MRAESSRDQRAPPGYLEEALRALRLGERKHRGDRSTMPGDRGCARVDSRSIGYVARSPGDQRPVGEPVARCREYSPNGARSRGDLRDRALCFFICSRLGEWDVREIESIKE